MSDSLRVCMLTTGFPRWPGDLFGSFVLELARALVAAGHHVCVVAPHEAGLPQREEWDGVSITRFRYVLPTRWARVAYGGGIPTNLKVSRVARLQVPLFLLGFWWTALRTVRHCDVVHCHWTVSGLVGVLATLFCPRPLVLTVRGSDIHLTRNRLVRWLNGWVYRRVGRLVAVSADIAAKLRHHGVPAAKVATVFNGVDARFRPAPALPARQQLALPGERFIVLFVGLLVPVKGLDILLRALAAWQDERVLGVLVGAGALRAELERQARELGVATRLLFADGRPSAEIPVWMQAADVLVLPSRSEGRPNVVLEAQACGLAVVATRVGGTPELITHEETGLLVPAEDARGLACQLRRLKEDPQLRRRLGTAGRRGISDQGLTWEANATETVALYRSLLREAGC